MKVILSVQPVRFPLTGIGRYTYELAKNLKALEAISELRYVSGEAFLAELPSSANESEERSSTVDYLTRLKRLVARNEQIVDAYRFLKERKLNRPFNGLQDHLYHGPNFYLPRFPGTSVVTFHDLSVLTMPNFHPKERVNYLAKEIDASLRRAGMIATDSDYIRSEIISRLGVNERKVGVAKLACGPEFRPRSCDEIDAVTSQYGLTYRRYTLYAGTIEPRKNLKALLDAYAQLPYPTRARYPLAMVGYKGWNNTEIVDRIEQGQREGWVRYLGFVRDGQLPLLFSGARLFAFPSLYEGFGLPVLEAMASGIPVLTSNRSSLPEVGGDAPLYVNPDDVDGIAAGLAKALEDEAWREDAIINGLRQASQFSWMRCAQDTVQIYRQALNGDGR